MAIDENEAIREYLLRHIDRRFERTASEIFEAFRDDYGSTARNRASCERRLWRHLQWLIWTGAVSASGRRGNGMTYRKLAKVGVPYMMSAPIACRECGAAWSRTETHGRHAQARQTRGRGVLSWAADHPDEFSPDDVRPPPFGLGSNTFATKYVWRE